MAPLINSRNSTDIYFEKGKGAYVYDENGKAYLDFASGLAVTSLGHCHPHLVAALTDQAQKLWHSSILYKNKPATRLAERLVEHSFADAVFFANSGAEAWEYGFKMIRSYFHAQGQHDKHRVVAMELGYHGCSMAGISATNRPTMTEGFGPLIKGFAQVPYNDLSCVEKIMTPDVAAVSLELVQGEAGVYPANRKFIKDLRALCDERQVLLYFDEIQTGMGRIGHLFAYEDFGVEPDLMCIGKGLGSGFPISACLAKRDIADSMRKRAHGSTYGGNPLATAVGNAVLDVICEEGFLENVREMSSYLHKRLDDVVEACPKLFTEWRGVGYLCGLQCAEGVDNRAFINVLMENGLLTAPSRRDTIRLLPPLIAEKKDIDKAVGIMISTAEKWV